MDSLSGLIDELRNKDSRFSVPRGELIVRAAAAAGGAIDKEIEQAGNRVSPAEVGCILAVLEIALRKKVEKLEAKNTISEIDQLFAMFGDKLQ